MRTNAAEGDAEWVQLSACAARLGAADWVGATWPAQEGGHKVYVHMMEAMTAQSFLDRYIDEHAALPPRIAALMGHSPRRTETLLEEYKDLLGSLTLPATLSHAIRDTFSRYPWHLLS